MEGYNDPANTTVTPLFQRRRFNKIVYFFLVLAAALVGVFAFLFVSFEAAFTFTASRISALKGFSSILSPSRKSIARRVPPSRLELNRPDGSTTEAPLAKVSFTAFL